ncbi:hypothetical protein TB1_021788 [Malus domestica]
MFLEPAPRQLTPERQPPRSADHRLQGRLDILPADQDLCAQELVTPKAIGLLAARSEQLNQQFRLRRPKDQPLQGCWIKEL